MDYTGKGYLLSVPVKSDPGVLVFHANMKLARNVRGSVRPKVLGQAMLNGSTFQN